MVGKSGFFYSLTEAPAISQFDHLNPCSHDHCGKEWGTVYVCVCVCMCEHVHTCVYMCVLVEVRSLFGLPSSNSFSFIFLSQCLSWNPELTGSTRLTGQKNQRSSCVHLPTLELQAHAACLAFYVGVVDPNWGPHVCIASTCYGSRAAALRLVSDSPGDSPVPPLGSP